MDSADHLAFTDMLLPTVLAAGRLEMGYFTSGCAVITKADSSPVTIADQQAEALIIAALERLDPTTAIIGEEAFAAGRRPPIGDRFYLVDALDGTKQFISGHPEFTINIALVVGARPVYGLIYAPALGELLVTHGSDAAYRVLIAPDATIRSLADAAPEQTRVLPAIGALTALQSRTRNLAQSNHFLDGFPVATRRQLGSSYKFLLIASGVADLYPQFGDTREWDTAAGEAVLTAAGGVVTDFDGQPLVYGKTATDFLNRPFIAASAPLCELRSVG